MSGGAPGAGSCRCRAKHREFRDHVGDHVRSIVLLGQKAGGTGSQQDCGPAAAAAAARTAALESLSGCELERGSTRLSLRSTRNVFAPFHTPFMTKRDKY